MFGLSGKYESLAEKVDRSQRLSRDEASVLAGAPLALLGLLASRVKERKSGREVYYNRNFHIEPTISAFSTAGFVRTGDRRELPTRGIIRKRRSSRRWKRTAIAGLPRFTSSAECIRNTTSIIMPI